MSSWLLWAAGRVMWACFEKHCHIYCNCTSVIYTNNETAKQRNREKIRIQKLHLNGNLHMIIPVTPRFKTVHGADCASCSKTSETSAKKHSNVV